MTLTLRFCREILTLAKGFAQVDAIQVCGGQMTADGKRRRSPGGVLWNIVRARVSQELYKDIMNVDRTIQVSFLSQDIVLGRMFLHFLFFKAFSVFVCFLQSGVSNSLVLPKYACSCSSCLCSLFRGKMLIIDLYF